jgi:hypothetical protein
MQNDKVSGYTLNLCAFNKKNPLPDIEADQLKTKKNSQKKN